MTTLQLISVTSGRAMFEALKTCGRSSLLIVAVAMISAAACSRAGAGNTRLGASIQAFSGSRTGAHPGCDKYAYGITVDGNYLYTFEKGENPVHLSSYGLGPTTSQIDGEELNKDPLHFNLDLDSAQPVHWPHPIHGDELAYLTRGGLRSVSLAGRESQPFISMSPMGYLLSTKHQIFQNEWVTIPAPLPNVKIVSLDVDSQDTAVSKMTGAGIQGWFVSQTDGTPIVRMLTRGENGGSRVEVLSNGSWQVTDAGADHENSSLFVPRNLNSDNNFKYWLLEQVPVEQDLLEPAFRLKSWSAVASGASGSTIQYSALGTAEYVQMSRDGSNVLWVEEVGPSGERKLTPMSPAGRQLLAALRGPDEISVRIISWSPDHDRAVIRTVTRSGNTHIFVASLSADGEPRNAFTLCKTTWPEFREPDVVLLGGSDGFQTKLIVFEPEGPSIGYVLSLHGGPWTRTPRERTSWISDLNQIGYTVVAAEYRGSAGYGMSYLNAGRGNLKGMVEDVEKARTWIYGQQEKRGVNDPVVLMGMSFGGILAQEEWRKAPDKYDGMILMSALFRPSVRTLQKGVLDPTGLVLNGEVPQSIFDLPDVPSSNANVLILHGARDHLVPIEEARAAEAHLRSIGAGVTLVELDADHDLACKANCSAIVQSSMEMFLGSLRD